MEFCLLKEGRESSLGRGWPDGAPHPERLAGRQPLSPTIGEDGHRTVRHWEERDRRFPAKFSSLISADSRHLIAPNTLVGPAEDQSFFQDGDEDFVRNQVKTSSDRFVTKSCGAVIDLHYIARLKMSNIVFKLTI